MKKHSLRIFCSICLIVAFLLGNLFYGYTTSYAQEGSQPSSKRVTYTWHMTSHQGSAAIMVALSPQVGNANCLGIALTINPGSNSVRVIMGISNQCGLTVATIAWIYTSTAICNGQTFDGPTNHGNVAQLASGVFLNVANDLHSSDCVVNGNLVSHTLSFTGTADGSLPPPNQGNTASGRADVGPVTIP